MKKIICLLLALIMTAAVFAGCSGGGGAETEKDNETKPITDRVTDKTGETDAEQTAQDQPTDTTEEEKDSYVAADGNYEDDKAVFSVGELKQEGDQYVLPLVLKNKSDSMALSMSVDLLTVNGIQMNYKLVRSTVNAGETSDNMSVSMSETDIQASGITSLDELVLKVHVYVTGYHTENYDAYLKFTTSPSGKTSSYPERYMTDKAQVLIENDKCYIAVSDIKKEDNGDYTVVFIVENKSSGDFHMMWEKTYVNGVDARVSFDPDSMFADYSCLCFVCKGYRKYNVMTIKADKLSADGITQIDEISFKLSLLSGFMSDSQKEIFNSDVVIRPEV